MNARSGSFHRPHIGDPQARSPSVGFVRGSAPTVHAVSRSARAKVGALLKLGWRRSWKTATSCARELACVRRRRNSARDLPNRDRATRPDWLDDQSGRGFSASSAVRWEASSACCTTFSALRLAPASAPPAERFGPNSAPFPPGVASALAGAAAGAAGTAGVWACGGWAGSSS